MIDRIRVYLEHAFANSPKTRRMEDLREELFSNLVEKYNDRLRQGMSEEDAYNAVIRSIGDIDELIDSARGPSPLEPVPAHESRIRALCTAIAVALYIMSPFLVILFPGTWGIGGMFLFIAAATGLLIYNGMTKTHYSRADDTIVEEFKEWHVKNGRQRDALNAFKGAYWSIVVAIYLLVSFIFRIWSFSWILFIMAGAVENIIKGIFALRR